MKKLLVILCIMLSVVNVYAGDVFDIEGVAGATEKLSTTLTSSVGFTATTYTKTGGSLCRDAGSTSCNPRAALISVETAAVRCTFDGTAAAVTGASQTGHLLNSGDSYVIRGETNITQTRCINAVASNGAVIMVTYYY
jgi:hypothetical protein